MVRTRSLLIAAAALGLCAGACKKNEEKKADNAASDKAADTTKPAGGGAAVAGTDDLSLLPADSEVVAGINIAQIQQSALWKQFGTKLMEQASNDLADFKAKCGFAPFEQIKSISVGLKGAGGDTASGAVVIHGPEKAKWMPCIDKVKDDAAAKGTEITVDGDVVLMKDTKDNQTIAWTFVADGTLLGVLGPNASKDTVLAAAKGASKLKDSPTFVELYSKINTKDSVWFLVNGNAPFMAKAALPGGKPPKAVFGSVNVTDGLALDLRVRMPSADDATSLVTMIKGQTGSPQVKQMFDKLDVAADGSDAKISVAMSNQKLQQLAAMFGGMLGGMMGGGMGAP